LPPITITLNGREVSGQAGVTILEIAQEVGVKIPTVCYDEYLFPVGACRLCLVENEATGELLAACATPISPGMIISTDSPLVLEHRKTIIKLLLASHPDSCLVCDKGNRCRLRQIASELGIGLSEMEKIPQFAAAKELNPFIVRDMAKCVLCSKCIRICQEVVVEGALGYFQRGFEVRPATMEDTPLERSECSFCGACVALCPTGALMEKSSRYKGTTSKSVQTTCAFCGCGCPITLEVKDGQAVRALPARGNFPNRGALCVRGSYGYDFIHSKKRVSKPLIKENSGFREASWEEALEVTAAAFKRIKEESGPESLAVFGSSKCTNEENYILQRFARTVLGTNNIDNGSSLYHAASREGLADTVGFFSASNLLDTLEQSDLILVVGADPAVSVPQVGYAIKRAVKFKQAKLIMIDPRSTKLTFYANLQLRPQPGTDLALLNSMAHVIVTENLLNSEYITRKTNGYEWLAAALKNHSPESTAGITGVPVETVRSAARLYAAAVRPVIMFGSGITRTADGADTVRALVNLALLTGNIWGFGCGVYPLQKESNGLGACDVGVLPDCLPGFQPLDDAAARKKFEARWRRPVPPKPGLTAFELLNQGKEKGIKGLYIVGENPLAGFPQPEQIASTLSQLDFLVVQDLFLTETARLAHVVLPAASFAEKTGSFTNFEGRIGRLQQAFPPVGESLADWEIILRLAKEMDDPLPYASLRQIEEEIEELVPLYEGYSQPESRLPDGWALSEDRRHHILHSLTGFPRFSAVEYAPRREEAQREYPYSLILEPTLTHFGAGTRSAEAWRLSRSFPPPLLKISGSDAAKLTLASREEVTATSPHGSLTVRAEITDTLPEGIVSLPSSLPGVLNLFGITRKEASKVFCQETCYVRLERVDMNE